MVTDAYGLYAQSFTLGQWRGQIGFTLDACNEIGVWGTLRDAGALKQEFLITTDPYYRAIDQVNLFWHHNFAGGQQLAVFRHAPTDDDQRRGRQPGHLHAWGQVHSPHCREMGPDAEGSYMRPSATPSFAAAIESAYSIGFGLSFYPGGCAATRTVAGNCWMPYLPVANNGSFLVDYNAPQY